MRKVTGGKYTNLQEKIANYGKKGLLFMPLNNSISCCKTFFVTVKHFDVETGKISSRICLSVGMLNIDTRTLLYITFFDSNVSVCGNAQYWHQNVPLYNLY